MLAERIAENLDISTLEELEQAAFDGRLEEIDGLGEKKVKNIKVSLNGMLITSTQRAQRHYSGQKSPKEQPIIDILLGIDEEYRRKAHMGELRKTAPKRFNPEREKWLPILNIEKMVGNLLHYFQTQPWHMI